MPAPLGHPRYGGRAKGTPNKRTGLALEIISKAGFCPLTALMDGYKIALASFTEEVQKVESGKLSPMESQAATFLRIAIDCASQLAQYVHPKLKSVEQIRPNQFDGMTPQEKLTMMKQMVTLLETQVAKTPQSNDRPGFI